MSRAHEHHVTAPEDRVPVMQKVAFGLGMAVPIAFVNSVAQLTNLIYNLGLGVSVVLLGIAQMIPRFWDAISDPIVGHISDRTTTRWGRRRPFILLGGIATSICYVLIWWVPATWSQAMLFAYYLGACLIFYTASTLFFVPLNALGCGMSRDYHEKTRLFAYGSFFGNVFAIMTPWMYKIANLDWFENEVEGMRYVALVGGVVILVTTVLPALVCKEDRDVAVSSGPEIRFWATMHATTRNRIFLRVVAVVFLITAGFNFVNNFTNYIMIFYVYGGDKAAAGTMLGINGTCWAITAIAAVFPMTWSDQNLGKARTVQLFIVLMVAGSFLKIVCYSPTYPWLSCFPTVLISAGMLALYTMAVSMVADVCSLDELESGHRREGSFSAVYYWWLKMAVSLGYLVSGLLLKSTGFDESTTVQSPSTLFWMRFWEIGLPGVLSLAGVLLLARYPLTEARAYEIKALLKQRKAQATP